MPSTPPPSPNNSSPPDWDQAEEAKRIVNSAPSDTTKKTRKRKVRTRIKQEQPPSWEAESKRPSAQNVDDVIEQLDETIQNKGSASDSAPRRRRQQGVHVREVAYTPGKNFTIAIIMVTVLGIGGVIGYAIYNKSKTETEPEYITGDLEGFMKGEAGSKPPFIADVPTPVSITPATPIKIEALRLKPVRDCISGFLTASTIEEKLQFVRPTPNVRAHMEAMKKHPVMLTQIEPTFGPAALEKEGFVYAEVLEAEVGYRGAILEVTEETALLDFDSFLGYSNVDWASLESGNPTPETEVRALISLLPPSGLDSPSRRRAIVRDPSQSFTIYAVIEIFGVPEPYAVLLERSRQALPYTVKIQTIPSQNSSSSAISEITEVVAAGWFKEVDFISAPVPEAQASPF